VTRRPQALRVSPALRRRRAILATLREWAADIAAFVGLLAAVVAWFGLLAMFDPALAPAVR
jgi:hypothetical protein